MALSAGFASCFLDSLALAIWRLTSSPVYNTTRATLLGYAVQFFGMLLDLYSLSLLTESTHSVVDAFSIVTMLVVSRLFLGENPEDVDVAGALCILSGICMTVLSRPADTSNADLPVSVEYGAVLARLKSWGTILWFSAFAAFVMVFTVCANSGYCRRAFAIGAGVVGALGETLAKAMTIAATARETVDTLAILAITGIYIFVELYIVRRSLKNIPMYVHQPTFYATWALGGIFSGGFVYGDFLVYAHHYGNSGVAIIGVALVLFGCLLPAALKHKQERDIVVVSNVASFLKWLVLPPTESYELETISRSI